MPVDMRLVMTRDNELYDLETFNKADVQCPAGSIVLYKYHKPWYPVVEFEGVEYATYDACIRNLTEQEI